MIFSGILFFNIDYNIDLKRINFKTDKININQIEQELFPSQF